MDFMDLQPIILVTKNALLQIISMLIPLIIFVRRLAIIRQITFHMLISLVENVSQVALQIRVLLVIS